MLKNFLFYIFQCLIHRNTLDPSEIQYHDKQISDQYKQEHGAPPENMMAIYEYLHEQEIEAMKEVKMMQQMYK